eukprot:scaffold17764_cov66-Phaeocystis_antarctica.AAC.6
MSAAMPPSLRSTGRMVMLSFRLPASTDSEMASTEALYRLGQLRLQRHPEGDHRHLARLARRAADDDDRLGTRRLVGIVGVITRAVEAGLGARLSLPGAGGRPLAPDDLSALVRVAQASTITPRAARARRRGACALAAAVRAQCTGLASLLALLVLVGARLAPIARAHACLRWRALDAAGEVGGDGVRALSTRQRRASAQGAVRARLASHTRKLPLARLVRAGRALGADACARARRDCTWAALGLLGAARRREVAWVGLVALVGASEVGRAGVRALHARQRRAGTRRAVRAVLASHAGLLALVGLVLAGLALVACAHAGARRDRAGAALGLHSAARRRVEAESGSSALAVTSEVGGIGVGARLAGQRRARALGAVRARRAGLARLLALLVLVGARLAPIARAHACLRDGWRALGAAGEVGGAGVRALSTRQRRASAQGAVRARLAGHTRKLALAGLVRAGRALGADACARARRDCTWAALGLLGAARRRIEAETGSSALVVTSKVGGIGVGARLARQRRRRALRAERAGTARLTCRLLFLILEGASGALHAHAHAGARSHGAGAALGLHGAAC